MALTKEQKQKIIEELKENIENQKAMVFVDFSGLKTKDLFELKNKLKQSGAILKVCKKTLLCLALKTKKIAVNVKNLQGQIAVVFGFEDEMAPLKQAYQFSQTNESLKILGGFLENEFQEKDYILTLAQLPSRQELWARLVGSVSAPMANFVNVLQANIKGLILALNAIKATK